METNQQHSDDDSNDEPNAKRAKMETECASASSTKPESKAKEPFLSLSTDILAKIIFQTPVAEWATLELLDKHFRAATLIAWRQLRSIDLDREIFVHNLHYSDFDETVAIGNSILHKLAERSPFLTSLNGFSLQSVNANMNSDAVRSLARFEHLQSITMGDATFYTLEEREKGTPLENVVEFLESTRSRASLKELRLIAVDQFRANRAMIRDQFAASFVNGREIRSPLKLEKYSFSSDDYFLRIRLDTLDATRLTDVRVGNAFIDPSQLTDLIERASQVSRIDLSLIYCRGECNAPRLAANKKLLTAMASHENWTTINFVRPMKSNNVGCDCTNCGRELIETLKTIGCRGRLRKLGFENYVVNPSSIDLDELYGMIRRHIPYLRAIKMFAVTDGCFIDIVNMTELEEIDLRYLPYTPLTENIIKQIARLPHLKRLSLNVDEDDHNVLKFLTDAKTLMDLRIMFNSYLFRASILDEWTEEFASKLETLMLSSDGETHDFDEDALVRLLAKAVRVRVLMFETPLFTDRSLTTIAHSCPQLETLSVRSDSYEISVECLQDVVNRCPNLTRWGGLPFEIREGLQIPKYRNIGFLTDIWEEDIWDFDDDE